MLVQSQRSVIALLGVHQHARRSMATKPLKSVVNQVGADALTLGVGFDGESLEIAAVGSSAGDGVADDSPVVPGDPEVTVGSGPPGLA